MLRLMKFSPIALIVVVALLAACTPASRPGGISCQNGICVKLQLSEPIRFNEPGTVTITVETDQDIPGLGVTLGNFDPFVLTEGTRVWDADTKAHQPVSFVGRVRFTHEGYFDVVGAAITREGYRVVDSVPVFITRAGGTVNPVVTPDLGPAFTVPMSVTNSPVPTPLPPQPEWPPTPWNRSLPRYTTNEIIAFCGWPVGATSAQWWEQDVKVWAEVPEEVPLNTPVAVQIAFEGEQSPPKETPATVALCLTDPSLQIDGQREWTITVQPGAFFTATVMVRFTQPGEFAVLAAAHDATAARVIYGGRLTHVVQVSGKAQNPSLIGWQTIMTQTFEGIWPGGAPGWEVEDLSLDGKERYWDDDSYKPHFDLWAAWPANGGADKIDPTLGNDRYPNNLDTRMIYGPFDLSDATLAHVNFWLWREVEANRDCLLFEASPDGVTFYTVRSWCDSDPNWRAYNEITFNGYAGDPSVWIAWRFYSDSSVTYRGPWLDDLELRKFVPGQITVQGSLTYADRAGHSQPARFLKAYLYDADPGGTDDRLAQATTLDNGTFAFPALRNWDVDNPDPTSTTGRLDLYVVWETEYDDGATSRRRVTKFNNQNYQWRSSQILTDALDGTANVNEGIPPNGPQERAIWIFQDLRKGWNYVHTATGSDPGSVSARWEKDQNSYLTCGLSCFSPLFGLFIGHDDAVSPDTVVHELGHHYMYNTRGFWISLCGAHGVFAASDQICAWAEGWADFLPLVVNGDVCYDFGAGSCTGTADRDYYNLESHARGDGLPEGDTVEGRVAGALYDLYDGTSDGLDHVGYGFDEIWTLMSTGAAENSFVDFWNNWKSSAYPQHWAVQAIFQNTIDYDVAPIIQLPDVTVFKDMVIDHVLDLWNYSLDPESADTDLSWSIVGMSNGNCGVAAQGHYIATAALAGFLGNCDITVRVSDGLKTSDDELNVRVVEVQARSFLPLILKNMTNPLQSPLVSPSPFASPLPVPVQPNPFVSPLPNPITP